METPLKPLPAEELDQGGQTLEVRYEKAPGERHLTGAITDTIGVREHRPWRPSPRASILPTPAL
jgi:hypothetical protein